MSSNTGENMGVCKCVVPSRNGVILNSRRAARPLVRLMGGEERWKASDPQGVLPLNWDGTEPNRTVTCMVLKATDNDRRTTSPLAEQAEDERGPMPTSAIKDLLIKWADVRAMVLEWHPYQADVSRVGDLYNNNAIN
ncbi:uncharacterized protein TNCV_4262351 [Trichonephila clavipes]|nr:uncharacterized protein TNCV_4262351 [Trichonephila clavipes]